MSFNLTKSIHLEFQWLIPSLYKDFIAPRVNSQGQYRLGVDLTFSVQMAGSCE